MSEIANRLRDRRLQLVNEMRDITDHAIEENRDLSAEETGRFQAINEEIDRIQSRIDGVLAQETRAKEADDAYNKITSKPVARGAEVAVRNGDGKQSELRAWMRGQGGREFVVPMEGPQAAQIRAARLRTEYRDLLTAAAGGVIDTGFRAQLWEYMIETSGVLQAGVDLLETDSGETIKLPRATVHSTAAAATEGVAITESDPTLSSVNSTVSKEGYVTQLSTELLADAGVDINGYLARSAGRELGLRVGLAAVTAAVAAASAGATTAAGTAGGLGAQSTADRGFDYLITLFHSVIAPYRNRASCAWLMSDLTAAMVRKVKTADGVYAWQPAVTLGAPDTILGKPVYIDTNVADAAVSVESIIFGDWSSLVVRIAGGFRFERSDDFAFNADLVTFRAIVRHGSVSIDANALKSLTHAGT